MIDLGKLQQAARAEMKNAFDVGDDRTLGLLGPVVADMQEKGQSWQRILEGLTPGNGTQAQSVTGPTLEPLKHGGSSDFAGRQINSVTALGKSIRVDSYKDGLIYVVSRLIEQHRDFETIAP